MLPVQLLLVSDISREKAHLRTFLLSPPRQPPSEGWLFPGFGNRSRALLSGCSHWLPSPTDSEKSLGQGSRSRAAADMSVTERTRTHRLPLRLILFGPGHAGVEWKESEENRGRSSRFSFNHIWRLVPGYKSQKPSRTKSHLKSDFS